MAKIKFYKLKGEIVKVDKIESISRFDNKAKENLLTTKLKLLKEQCSTRIKAKEIVISSQAKENKTKTENL